MKTEYLLFREEKPRDIKEILHLLLHFCQEHELRYYVSSVSDRAIVNIEGADYYVELQEKKEFEGSAYWIIHCILKTRLSSARLPRNNAFK